MGIAKNLLLGWAAGAAGTAAMGAYWKGVAKVNPDLAYTEGGGTEPTINRVAKRAMQQAGVKSPSRQAREVGGQVVHWGYGTHWGAIAGLSRAAGMPLTWGGGLLFGAGLWALGDLWMLYKMGLARHPKEYPMSVHVASLGAHLAYGVGVWAAMEAMAKATGENRRMRRAA